MTMKNNLKRIVITGGAGFIGSNLCRKLLKEGAEKILIIDDLSTGKIKNIEDLMELDEIEFIESRVEDIKNLNETLSNFDFCFHLAAGVGVQYIMDNVSKALLTNIEGTHKIIESCKNNNHIVVSVQCVAESEEDSGHKYKTVKSRVFLINVNDPSNPKYIDLVSTIENEMSDNPYSWDGVSASCFK